MRWGERENASSKKGVVEKFREIQPKDSKKGPTRNSRKGKNSPKGPRGKKKEPNTSLGGGSKTF